MGPAYVPCDIFLSYDVVTTHEYDQSSFRYAVIGTSWTHHMGHLASGRLQCDLRYSLEAKILVLVTPFSHDMWCSIASQKLHTSIHYHTGRCKESCIYACVDFHGPLPGLFS
jgi:hypothetical protein